MIDGQDYTQALRYRLQPSPRPPNNRTGSTLVSSLAKRRQAGSLVKRRQAGSLVKRRLAGSLAKRHQAGSLAAG